MRNWRGWNRSHNPCRRPATLPVQSISRERLASPIDRNCCGEASDANTCTGKVLTKMTPVVVAAGRDEWQSLKALVLDSVSSPHSRRLYNLALDDFTSWYVSHARSGFNRAIVSAWRASLEARGLGSSSINIRLSAVRKLASEAADNGLIAPELAAGVLRIRRAKTKGVRMGNWLSLRQAQSLLGATNIATIKGLRDRAMLAVLLGCGLRRSEVASLTLAHIEMAAGALSISRASMGASAPRPCQVGSWQRLTVGHPPLVFRADMSFGE